MNNYIQEMINEMNARAVPLTLEQKLVLMANLVIDEYITEKDTLDLVQLKFAENIGEVKNDT